MNHPLQYTLLVLVGVVSGFAAHRLSASVRGSLKKQFIRRYFIEGIAIAPGIALALIFLNQRGGSPNLLETVRLESVLILPYVAARIIAHRWSASRSVRRGNTVPFSHWFALLRTNPGAAHEFLTTYLAQYDDRRTDPVDDLRVACAFLEQTRGADPLLPAALDRLRFEIARLELTGARLPRSTELP